MGRYGMGRRSVGRAEWVVQNRSLRGSCAMGRSEQAASSGVGRRRMGRSALGLRGVDVGRRGSSRGVAWVFTRRVGLRAA